VSDREFAGADPECRRIVEAALPYTMTGVMRLRALVEAVRYCEAAAIPGSYAECGVWQGGSVLAMILTLQERGVADRDIYLFDTFEGMTEPTEDDSSDLEPDALQTWREAEARGEQPWRGFFDPATFSERSVHERLLGTGYPPERIHVVRGRVEDTIPADAPDQLALLRLDTDWYESTHHEMVHLYPALERGGVLIIDDYGHWKGARRAVDEYFGDHGPPVMLTPIDYSARLSVKP
jgi:O-methyltransferase